METEHDERRGWRVRSERALKRQLFGCHVDEWPLGEAVKTKERGAVTRWCVGCRIGLPARFKVELKEAGDGTQVTP